MRGIFATLLVMTVLTALLVTTFVGCNEHTLARNKEKQGAAKLYADLNGGTLLSCAHPTDASKDSMCVIKLKKCRVLIAVQGIDNVTRIRENCK